MTTLLSSPMGPPARYDIFDQPSSPTLRHDELPADFDKSFSSSMSISNSLEGSHIHHLRLPHSSSLHGCFGNPGRASQLTHARLPEEVVDLLSSPERRASPKQTKSLGAAMGTYLNTSSPGLAAKFSSDYDMDISPQPKFGRAASSEGRFYAGSASCLPPGSAMKEDRDIYSLRSGPSASSSSRQASDRPSPPSSASSLGRLFGTELAINRQRAEEDEEDHELQSSPDKEPPSKRRPASLPSRQPAFGSAVFGKQPMVPRQNPSLAPLSTTRARPSLMKSFTAMPPPKDKSATSQGPNRPTAPRHHSSDSSLATSMQEDRARIRAASSDSILCGDQVVGSREVPQRQFMPDTIIESPSPASIRESGIGDYFFDPQSPQKADRTATRPNPVQKTKRPSLMACLSSTSSSPISSPSNRAPAPKRPTLGNRTFEKTHSAAVVPINGSFSGTSSSRSLLGKRPNPYSKRPSVLQDSRALKSANSVLGSSGGAATRVAVAPLQRCNSAIDDFGTISDAPAKLRSGSDRLGPRSPERKPCNLTSFGENSDHNGSPVAPSSRIRTRPGMLRRPSKDDSSPLGYGTGIRRSGSRTDDLSTEGINLEELPMLTSSPYSGEGMPGFGTSEKEGKILPCFTVKNDGLMRITPKTLTDLLAGKYSDLVDEHHIVDCRFDYEYEGGHILGAINLGTMEKVKSHFLRPGHGIHQGSKPLPPRSQSGKADVHGNRRKQVIVFHCEFSCKRAPSMALALRQADRSLAQDYPNCHFPEIYILHGGYCEFFNQFSSACQPRQYVCMDDPRFVERCSNELNGFRKQFSRNRSFTYGDTQSQGGVRSGGGIFKGSHANNTIGEEDSSFDASPCVAGGARSGGRGSLIPGVCGSAAATLGTSTDANVGDTSFGSVGDSSFEGGIGDSPCAAAGSRRPSMFLGVSAMSNQAQLRNSSLGRRTLQRAGTTGDILTR
ncbi:hypothetical protein IE53DRAFT_101095 [Violaceomyces palustris]|uniref:Uncharacterized protein n=1 Tax=Violaceomyces palustris TaxID=1673888 RepID=A0ACD0NWX2_9BASI|nr:hypothetical protein IE53DRAFT_101095 [Violaceomyces palustris]